MELFDVTQVALERALAGSALRQRALADNLANANTPGFKRSDVDFHGALARALDGAAGPDAVQFAMQEDTTTSARADGNNVDVDAEMASLAENALDYQSLATVAKARVRILETAINGR